MKTTCMAFIKGEEFTFKVSIIKKLLFFQKVFYWAAE
jgi:hypothetical protein